MTEQLKVFMVDVEIRMQVPVVATSKEEAEDIADRVYEEEYENGVDRDATCSALHIDSVSKEDEGIIPYGVRDSDPRRDWTIKRWLASQNLGSDM